MQKWKTVEDLCSLTGLDAQVINDAIYAKVLPPTSEYLGKRGWNSGTFDNIDFDVLSSFVEKRGNRESSSASQAVESCQAIAATSQAVANSGLVIDADKLADAIDRRLAAAKAREEIATSQFVTPRMLAAAFDTTEEKIIGVGSLILPPTQSPFGTGWARHQFAEVLSIINDTFANSDSGSEAEGQALGSQAEACQAVE